MIVGTAGHVDHGKTALVKALTGIDTDRLPEEKRRGMTIELGFAHLQLPSREVVGVVDVPGHEQLVKTMAAGVGGLDVALLVIAADEGVMPQTREHFDICRLLGVRRGLVVITKADLLPALGADWLAAVQDDIKSLVRGSVFEGAPVQVVSAKTGLGLPQLVSALEAEVAALRSGSDDARGPDGPLLVPIDRVFSVKGFGLVVTGTVWSGRIGLDDWVNVLPDFRQPLRVRHLQVHERPVTTATRGTRVAVNIPDLDTTQVRRGMALTIADELPLAKVFGVEVSLLPSTNVLARRTRQQVTLGTLQTEAALQLFDNPQLRPGEKAFAQLRFAAPVAALVGQHFVLRGLKTEEGRYGSVGGGRILLRNPPRQREGAVDVYQRLAGDSAETRALALLQESGYRGLDERQLFSGARLGRQALHRALNQVLQQREAFRLESAGAIVAQTTLNQLKQRMVAAIETFHREQPEQVSLPRPTLRQRVGEPPEALFERALDDLIASGQLEALGEQLRQSGRGPALSQGAASQKEALAALLESRALSPPTQSELEARLHVPTARVRELARLLIDEGRAVRVGDLYFSQAAVSALERRLLEYFERNERLSLQDFKVLTGLSRKFLVPLAEYFDATKVTLRVGESRVLRRKPGP